MARRAQEHQGLQSTAKEKKPLITDRHKQSMHEWAKEHKDYME